MIVADAQGALFPAETKFSSLANAVPYDEKIITWYKAGSYVSDVWLLSYVLSYYY